MKKIIRVDIAIVYFTSIAQAMIDFSDEFQLFRHPIFKQRTKQSLSRLIQDLEVQVKAFCKPESYKHDVSKYLKDGETMEDVNFGMKEVISLTDYADTFSEYYRCFIKLSILAEKDPQKAENFTKEYIDLLKKYELL